MAGQVILLLLALISDSRGCTEQEYLNNEEVLEKLDNIAANDPSLASSYTIGFSGQGTELRVLRISAAAEDAMVPQVKFIGGLHGNEPPSTHILINFAQYLIESYNRGEPFISWLLKNARIHILPRLNPDGFNEALEGQCGLGPGRNNGNGVDLNRAFPRAQMSEEELLPQFQPEVEAVMRWSEEERFVLGAALHSGALVAVYPLDSPLGEYHEGEKAKTRDDDIFVHLATTYSDHHLQMRQGLGCDGKDGFPGGIVNGAEWYRASGSMMDYNYLFAGTMELTLELYCCKYPPPRLLCQIWEQNKLALLKYSAESIRGVRGVVSSSGIPLEMATVTVLHRDLVVSTNSKGQFFRLLLPGRYYLQFDMIGMKSKVMQVEIQRQDTAYFSWTEVYVELQPEVDRSEESSSEYEAEPAETQTQEDLRRTQGQREPNRTQSEDLGSRSQTLHDLGTSQTQSYLNRSEPPTSRSLPTEYPPTYGETPTSFFDEGGIDPNPADGSLYPQDSQEFLNESSIFTQKSIHSMAPPIKMSYLLFVIPFLVIMIHINDMHT